MGYLCPCSAHALPHRRETTACDETHTQHTCRLLLSPVYCMCMHSTDASGAKLAIRDAPLLTACAQHDGLHKPHLLPPLPFAIWRRWGCVLVQMI